MKIPDWIVRYGEPTKYDQLPYGTICKRLNSENSNFTAYMQMSKNECCPQWEKIGEHRPETLHLLEEEVARILKLHSL